jgi:urease accessory protein UreF
MSIDKISVEEISIMQLCDSFFPTGMYTMSSGLEALFYSKKKLRDANELRDLINVYIEDQQIALLLATPMDVHKAQIYKNCSK